MNKDSDQRSATLTVSSKQIPLKAILEFSDAFLEDLGFDKAACINMRLALEEVIAFVDQTVFCEGDAEPLAIVFDPAPAQVRIRLTAKGLPMDDRALPAYSPAHLDDEAGWAGLSLHLAQHAMDQVTLTNRGSSGFIIELRKFRNSGHVAHTMEDRPEDAPSREPTPPPAYRIRPATPEEALAISQCAYLTYGYSYEDYIYYPELIEDMNRSGSLYSLVAVNTDGTVMGHCALKFGEGQHEVAELGALFVRPEYRRHGMGSALWSGAVSAAESMRLKSLFSRSVTGHRASQELARRHGFSDCALALALFPRNVDLKDMGGLLSDKMSGIRQWKSIRPARTEPTVVYPPACYNDIITELYHQTGISIQPGDNDSDESDQREDILLRVYRVPALNVGLIDMISHGHQIPEATDRLRALFRQLCREKLDTIYLTLNIQQPGADTVAEYAVTQGFIFSGIVPDAFATGDGLALQYLNLTDNPFEKQTVWTPTARMLRDYIKQEWENGI